MGVKQKAAAAEEAGGGAAEEYQIDWREQARRPFKRGFIPYGSEADAKDAAKRRKGLGIELIEDPAGEDATPLPLESFEEIGALPPWILDALRDDECYEPTPLQAQALPIALAGQNLVAVTSQPKPFAAYFIPAAVHVEDQPPLAEDDPGPIVLVMAPTQEDATKITEEATNLFRYSDRSARLSEAIRTVCVSGGGTRSEKLRELSSRGSHIMVGTPKRVHDMAMKEQISLLRVTLLILDGVDKMLSLGFENEIRQLSTWMRPERHTLLIAATWPKPLHDLQRELCYAGGQPVRFGVSAPPKASAAARQKDPGSGARQKADAGAAGKEDAGEAAATDGQADGAQGAAGDEGAAAEAEAAGEAAEGVAVEEGAVQADQPAGDFPDGW